MDNRQNWQPQQQDRAPRDQAQRPDDAQSQDSGLFGDEEEDEFDSDTGSKRQQQNPGLAAEERDPGNHADRPDQANDTGRASDQMQQPQRGEPQRGA